MQVRKLGAIALIACMLLETGCYDWVPVRPSEAPKLSGSFSTMAEDSRVLVVRTVDVVKPDGRMAQIKGEFDLRVNLRNGEVRDFTHPVRIEKSEDTLVFAGANRAATPIPELEIRSIEVSQYSAIQTGFLSGALTAVGMGIVIALIRTSGD